MSHLYICVLLVIFIIATGCENKGYNHHYIISHQEKEIVEAEPEKPN
ncbi:MAG: hypothetical protein LVR00_09110 [Rhabdochlamydiaceae bacterium]